jgi:hypothetical protein
MRISAFDGIAVLLFVLVGLGTVRMFALHNQGSSWADGILLLTG